MNIGDSISNAIVIDEKDYISGVSAEHNYINQLCSSFENEIESIEQELIFDNDNKFDVFTIKLNDGDERKVCFDISSFFNKIYL